MIAVRVIRRPYESCRTHLFYSNLAEVRGIEPRSSDSKSEVMPLYDTPIGLSL